MIDSFSTVEPIRIAYLIDFLSRGGGMENQLHLLLKHLDRDRFVPHLITLRSGNHSRNIDVDCPVFYLGIEGMAHPSMLNGVRTLIQLLRRHRIDILQIFSVDSNILGVPAGKLAGIRKLVIGRRDTGLWYKEWRKKLVVAINCCVDFCIANSEAVRQAVIREEGLAPEQVTVIHNGVQEHQANQQPSELRQRLGIPADVPIVGIAANLREVKRFDLFLHAIRLLEARDAHALIMGTGPLKEYIQRLIREFDLQDRVHVHHTIGDVFDYIKLFTVGVLTSETEGLSNSLIEYGQAGIPSVAFSVGGNPEVIVDGETGLLARPLDAADVCSKIDRLLRDPDLLHTLGNNARKVVRDRFSVETMVKNHQEFYVRILNNHAQQSHVVGVK